MLVFGFSERYILHFLAPKKRRNPCPEYLVFVLQQALYMDMAENKLVTTT
jgi:hypothetical protein